jgi:alcohol dehydrogenase class IV
MLLCAEHVGMALHHTLCPTLGESFNLPHAETHAIKFALRTGIQQLGVA